MDLSAEMSLNIFGLKKMPRVSYSLYVASYPQWVSAVVRKNGAVSLLASDNGSNLNFGFRWNYSFCKISPLKTGIITGINIEKVKDRFTSFPKGTGVSVNDSLVRGVYLDNVVKRTGIFPSLQIGIYRFVKLRGRSYLKMSLYGNVGLRTKSYWYYRGFVDTKYYSGVIENGGSLLNFSLNYAFFNRPPENTFKSKTSR